MARHLGVALFLALLAAALVGCVGSHGSRATGTTPTWSHIEVRLVSETGSGDALPRLSAPDTVVVERVPVVAAGGVRDVKLVDQRPTGSRYLSFELDDAAARALATATATAVGRRLAVIVDGKVAAVLTVKSPLSGRAVAVTMHQDSELDAVRAAISR